MPRAAGFIAAAVFFVPFLPAKQQQPVTVRLPADDRAPGFGRQVGAERVPLSLVDHRHFHSQVDLAGLGQLQHVFVEDIPFIVGFRELAGLAVHGVMEVRLADLELAVERLGDLLAGLRVDVFDRLLGDVGDLGFGLGDDLLYDDRLFDRLFDRVGQLWAPGIFAPRTQGDANE